MRRLKILLVDALLLGGLGAVAFWLFELDTAPSQAAEPPAGAPALVDLVSGEGGVPAIEPGHRLVSARVVAERSPHLIMPGDYVDLSRGPGTPPVLEGARVLAIEPPLTAGDERLHLTFSMPAHEAGRLVRLREEALLYARLSAIGGIAVRPEFEPPRPSQVITLRFAEEGWARRLLAE